MPSDRDFLKKILILSLPILMVVIISFLILKTPQSFYKDSGDSVDVPPKNSRAIAKILDYVENNYVDTEALKPKEMLLKAAKNLEQNIAPFLIKDKDSQLQVSLDNKTLTIPLSDNLAMNDIVTPMAKLLGFVDLFYEDKSRLDDDERMALLMNGVTDTLDAHSNYLPPKAFVEFKIGTKGNFGGLGIVIGIRDETLTVIAPIEDTPADKAGIKAKDKIVQIGEESTVNMSLTEAVDRLRGTIGSRVNITITREGLATPMKVDLVRALIQIKSVAGRLLPSSPELPKKIAHIKLKNFQEDTFTQFYKFFEEYNKPKDSLDGIILDLRNDPGGLLDQAIQIGDFFLKEGVIVKTVGAKGETFEVEEARSGQAGENIPLVLILNEGSASASEIVAGALQLNDRAIVIGSRSFGKGSVQTVSDLKDGSALKLTIANYLTAYDYKVQSIGINPDIGLLPAVVSKKMVDLRENKKRRESDYEEKNDRDDEELNAQEKEDKQRALLPPPPIQMTYLDDQTDIDQSPETLAKEKDDENSAHIKLEDDFPVKLAQLILSQPSALTLHRKKMVADIPPLLEKLKAEELSKIEKTIGKIDIDWSSTLKTGKLEKAKIEVSLLDEAGNKKTSFKPGESGFIQVTVENTSKNDVYQLLAVSESKDYLFSNLEFPFGHLAPGEKRTWKNALKIPDFSLPRRIPLTLEFYDADHQDLKPLWTADESYWVEVASPPLPSFEYQYAIVDKSHPENPNTKNAKGNGNGIPEIGETIALQIKVKNIGNGPSAKPIITLKTKDTERLFIEKGRMELKKLEPGQVGEGTLLIRMPEKALETTVPEKLPLEFFVLDNQLGQDLSDRLNWILGEAPDSPHTDTWQTPPVIDVSSLNKDNPYISSEKMYPIQGVVTDDQRVRDFYVYVGDEKITYLTPTDGEKTLHFDLKIPLKKGINTITLVGQDDRELSSRKQWVVWRP